MKLISKLTLSAALIGVVVFQSGCGLIDGMLGGVSNAIGLTDTATVISKTAQIRTSYAVVAADLLEVKRGEQLEVLDQMEFEKVLWYRVRANDDTNTEGWIEAQHVITSEVLDKSRKLAEESGGPGAAGGRTAEGGVEPEAVAGDVHG
ncbi:MAG: hypothetical protein IPM25_00250 [Chloracidobacterium sp.]|nr:hypothetical protein [Chloracidobacterium sp.]